MLLHRVDCAVTRAGFGFRHTDSDVDFHAGCFHNDEHASNPNVESDSINRLAHIYRHAHVHGYADQHTNRHIDVHPVPAGDEYRQPYTYPLTHTDRYAIAHIHIHVYFNQHKYRDVYAFFHACCANEYAHPFHHSLPIT